MMKEKNELSKKWESLTFAFSNTKIGSQSEPKFKRAGW